MSNSEISNEMIVRANGVDLCVQTFGDRRHPPILLIMGMGSSMDWWEDEFCERLARGPRFVIRYDHRDTGRSAHDPPGAPRYKGNDLVSDAACLGPALGLSRVHVVGHSMGGAVAQRMALDYPDRVASLTLASTSALGPDLPPMSDALRAHFTEAPTEPDWSDPEAVVACIVDDWRPYVGSRPFDEARVRAIARRVVARTVDMASSRMNHALVDDDSPPWRPRLGEIAIPTLVIHGDEDPLFPLGHGRALAREIPNARLLVLEQTGHEIPPATWDIVISAILEHTSI